MSEWKIVRSESYGTLFNCSKGHEKFLSLGELPPADCPYCALVVPAPLHIPNTVSLEEVIAALRRVAFMAGWKKEELPALGAIGSRQADVGD